MTTAAEAELAYLTTVKPAAEHNGKTPASWFIYREVRGKIVRMPIGDWGLSLNSEYLYWLPRKITAEPETPRVLPTLSQSGMVSTELKSAIKRRAP